MKFLLKASTCVLLAGSTGLFFGMTGCNKGASTGKAVPETAGTATTKEANASGPIDVCGIVTPAEAKALLGPLPMQPPAATDSVGFGIYMCMYIGPKLSGEGAQTVFSRLTVEAGSGKDVPDLLQMDADKRHAVITLSGAGDEAKRNAAGSFVWAKQGALYCTAEIGNGLPPGLTADSAATQLTGLCSKIFAKIKR